MTIEVTIRVDCDDLDDYLGLQRLLLDRYNRVRFTVDSSGHIGDAASDDDVDPDMILSILNGARAHASAPARLVIDQMAQAMGFEPLALDEPRVTHDDKRVGADDPGHEARLVKMQVVADNACPQCKAPAGQPCRSPRGHVYDGGRFTHQARINAWYEQREALR
ncbi:MAG TPA: hypothetical protein VFX15_03635 [Actinomycetes bacterium]|nr:hypothetical protein [Actinomycetes bacterium]